MIAQPLADAPREVDLRAQQLGIGVEVADGAVDDRAAADGSESGRSRYRVRASSEAAS